MGNLFSTIIQLSHHVITQTIKRVLYSHKKAIAKALASLGIKNILTKSIGRWHLKGWRLNDDFPSGVIMFILSTIVKLSPIYFLWQFLDFTLFCPLNFCKRHIYTWNLPLIGFTLSPLALVKRKTHPG